LSDEVRVEAAYRLLHLASHQQSIFHDEFDDWFASLSPIQLSAKDLDVGWGDDAERYSVALDFHDFNGDVAIDYQPFTHFST
jgi:hypothetical protein